MEKQTLGPLQTEWVEYLEAHPEQQTQNFLGRKDKDGNWKLCCLGAGELILCKYNNKEPKIGKSSASSLIDGEHNFLISGEGREGLYLSPESAKELGLRDHLGSIKYDGFTFSNGVKYVSLAGANDSIIKWPEIAKFIRENPELVFAKSL